MMLRWRDIGRYYKTFKELKMVLKFESKEWLAFIISMLLITDLAIILDISFMRQILGFLFLTVLPGLLILQTLKLEKIDFLERLTLSWGISISFLMFFGLLINNLALALGYKTPLATIPLLILFNIAFILLAIKTFGKSFIKTSNLEEVGSIGLKNWLPKLNLTTSEKAFLSVPILFPALSIFGMHVMNTTNNNIILMFLLFLIPVYIVFVCLFNHKIPKRLYPVVIFLISISLLLLMSLRSNHLLGIDTHVEYSFFQVTLDNLHWSIFGHSDLDACLCISLLPTIYQSMLNISPEYLFKILYSLIFSVSPLVIYVLSKKYVEEGYAFLASCFFMFQTTFLWTVYHARANIAILFFAFAMMTLFNDKIDPLEKKMLFIVFMASCMVSHYSTTYIFFFIMLGTFIGIEIHSKKYSFKKIISVTTVVLFFSMIFFWYSQVTKAAFNSGVVFIQNTLRNLNRFFVEESRGEGAQTLLGKGFSQMEIPYKIHFVLTWIIFALIGIGIITLIGRYREMSFPELKFKKPDFLKDKFEVEYFVIALVCSGLLVAVVAVPYISDGYGLGRLYPLAITILSVFFVIGGIILSKHFFFKPFKKSFIKNALQKRKPVLKEKQKSSTENTPQVRAYLIILLILIPYFLCVTGVTYQMFGVPRAITLNSEGEDYDLMYVHDQESCAAKWLGNYRQQNLEIYSDHSGSLRLMSQRGISSRSILNIKKIEDGYIYLRYYNLVADEFLPAHGEAHNMTEYSDIFIKKSTIYDNGGSVIYW